MLFIDIELICNTKKNEKRQRFDCFINKVEKNKKTNAFEKKNRNQ